MREIYWELPQQSEEWFALRVASIGGSKIGTVASTGSGRTTYLKQFAVELQTGKKFINKKSFKNKYMEEGNRLEPEAALSYSMSSYGKNLNIQYPGLVKLEPHIHVSPDFTVGLTVDSCHLVGEIKSVSATTQMETILRDTVPAIYRKQCQWEAHVCGAELCVFVSYCPEYTPCPLFVIPYGRDARIVSALVRASTTFIKEAKKRVESVEAKIKAIRPTE